MLKKIGISWLSTLKISMAETAVHVPVTDRLAQRLALEHLTAGSVIALPTDTVYGLACDATNSLALDKLYQIKERCFSKPLAICLGDVSEIKIWADVQHIPDDLLDSLLPGPFTIILNSVNKSLHDSLKLNDKVGIRVPNYNFIRSLSRKSGKPLALTSANLSNEPSAVEVAGFNSIWTRIPIIFDGGILNCGGDGSASTIVDLSEVGFFNIIRVGVGYDEAILKLKRFGLSNKGLK